MKQVIILRGLPGSGKSTLVSKIEEQYGTPAFVCSADDFHYHGKPHTPENYDFDPNNLHLAHKICKQNFTKALEANTPLVVVDNTNIRLREYKWYFLTAHEHGYNVEFHTIKKCSIQQSYKCNVHNVPMIAIDKMNNSFADTPTEIEGIPVDEVVYDFHELRGKTNGKFNKKINKKSARVSVG